MIRRYDPTRADAALLDDIMARVRKVIESGQFIGGEEVDGFARAVSSDWMQGHSVIPVANGTDALTIALLANKQGWKDEAVVLPSLTFSATASAALRAGLRIKFVDQDVNNPFLLDLGAAYGAAFESGSGISTVIPVHLYGEVADPTPYLDRAFREMVTTIEDACQAFGASSRDGKPAGILGDAAAFSFFPSKPLGCYGDGGMIVTRHAQVADVARLLSRHGASRRYYSEIPGMNSRLDALQAAILRVKLEHAKAAHSTRLFVAQTYSKAFLDRGLHGERFVLPGFTEGHAMHLYTIRVLNGQREALLRHLWDHEVDASVAYPVPLHQQPAFAKYAEAPLRIAEKTADEILCLPCWDGLTAEEVTKVTEVVADFFAKN